MKLGGVCWRIAVSLTLLLLLGAAQTPAEKLKAALESARAAGSFTYRFELKTRIPMSDPFEAKGRGVALGSRTLFMDVKGTGGIDKKVVTTPKGTLLWHAFLEDWVTDVEYGDAGAGHGFQNPHDLMDALLPEVGRAVPAAEGRLTLRFEAKEAVEVLGRLRIDPKRLRAEGTWIEMTAAIGEGRLRSVRSTARINFVEQPGAAQAPDHFEYDATVTVEAYDRDQRPSWPGIDVAGALKRLAP
jgi:hypothetical protein